MNSKELKVLKELLDYLEPDEYKHFLESGKYKKHIYRHIQTLKKFLRKNNII